MCSTLMYACTVDASNLTEEEARPASPARPARPARPALPARPARLPLRSGRPPASALSGAPRSPPAAALPVLRRGRMGAAVA